MQSFDLKPVSKGLHLLLTVPYSSQIEKEKDDKKLWLPVLKFNSQIVISISRNAFT
jgi:hypothetical protein